MTVTSFLRLVEIQTKVASMIPFFLGTLYALYRFEQFNMVNFALMFISLLSFDMTTTAMNNYIDYKKAIKTHGYGYEIHNAIVSYKIGEKTVVATILTMLITAIVAGFLLFLQVGIIVLLLGAFSFAIGILYSFGPIPISRTPLGEIFSGFLMGFVIPFLAAFIHINDLDILLFGMQNSVLSFQMDIFEVFYIFLISIPAVAGIANIMLANNICDMEEDIENRRYTLPIYIGKERALVLFRSLYYIGYGAILLGIIFGVAPWTSILVLATFIPVSNHIKKFNQLQTKKDTFILAVKNFVLINAAQVLAIAIGILINQSM